jgi:hypothetical protein
MNNFSRYLTGVSVALSIVIAASVPGVRVEAEAEPAGKKKQLPSSGSLSTSISTGAVDRKIPDVWGGVDSKDEAPIAGSVSRLNPSTWQMKVFNNSSDTYSANLGVVQRNSRGSVVKTDSFSYTLRPNQSESRTISAGLNATEAALDLRSFKNLSQKKRDAERARKSSGDASASVPETNK